MSLTYLYNKLENMNSREQYCYIQNVFFQFQIRPRINIDEIFKPKSDKEVKGKNPLGYLVMELNPEQLEQLVPEYLRKLCGFDTFDTPEQLSIFNTIQTVVDCIDEGCIPDVEDVISMHTLHRIDKADILNVFSFGHGKYKEWNFLEHNPYLLIPALFRHMYKGYYISNIDEESGVSHFAHAYTNIRMIQMILENKNAS